MTDKKRYNNCTFLATVSVTVVFAHGESLNTAFAKHTLWQQKSKQNKTCNSLESAVIIFIIC